MRQSSYTLSDMGKIVSLTKRRGFIFPSSEIYGGFGNFWDYGPLGVLLKTNVKAAWFRTVVQERDDIIPLDSTIIMHPRIWEASGHVQNFTDPLVDCKKCGKRWRADTLADGHCPECGGDVTETRQFNLMFKTHVGPVADDASSAYLRPETAQGIFVNFKSAMTALRMKPPFGIAQIGKAFRNEITPGNFTFRTREFEQMEIEFFIMPGTDAHWFEYWVAQRRAWYEQYGMRGEKLRLYEHPKEALAHYSRGTFDVEYEFPFGWGELEGIANRGDYDLAQHEQFSGEELRYFVEESKQHIRPEVIEPSAGADRATLAFLLDAYDEEPDGNETRIVLRFHPALAPYKAAILPLQRKPDLIALANSIRSGIRNRFMTTYDETGSIGRRYRRQDEIGTPFCVTPDFQSLEDHAVTVRDRDDMTQERIPIADLGDWLEAKIARGIGRADPGAGTGAHTPRGMALAMASTTTQSSVLSPQSSTKWVYLFEEGSASMRALLGGKGAGCAEMTRAGLPVPPGFTITTEACNAYRSVEKQFPEGMWEQVLTALRVIEEKTGKKLGDPSNPLLVSVRSGAAFSMPGMMDTVLNLGLNDETAAGLAHLMQNDRFAQDAYRRFIQMYGRIVMGIDARAFDEKLEATKERHQARADTDLDVAALSEIVLEFKEVVRRQSGREFPIDPVDQLRLAIGAVFSSWMGDRAVVYREAAKIPHDLGTAVNVQTMVFGNMGNDSGTGVAFTRNPATGERALYGDFLVNAQGEDVVAGTRTPMPIASMPEVMPEVYREFTEIADRLERTYRDVQDVEFTVERGKLYMLQTRTAQRTAEAAVRIAADMVREAVITKDEALQRVQPDHVVQLLLPRFDPSAKERAINEGRMLAVGISASPGAAFGQAVFDADRADELGSSGQKVLLVRPETSPDDVHGMIAAQGVLTSRGGKTSHAAVVARGMGKPAVVGAEAVTVDLNQRVMRIGDRVIPEGEWLSIDGATGEVFSGEIASILPSIEEQGDLLQVLRWADERRRLQVWANADYPRDAERAREFGAQGIGLCRTEHMFMEQDRLPVVQQMILAAPEASRLGREAKRLRDELAEAPSSRRGDIERRLSDTERLLGPATQEFESALAQLLPIQRNDFKGILKAMEGLPVVIRLLDPPLHEFLPDYEDLLLEVADLRRTGSDASALEEKSELLSAVEAMRESNPMLGLRGCRLGLMYPGINEMQVRAILEAACQLKKQGVDARPEIMIPLVGHVNELDRVRGMLEATARQVMTEQGIEVEYKFGTMIEVPRAALTADEIAKSAEFFSFGTNDLTQMTFGFSRDDAEGKFLARYIEEKILPENPFQSIDTRGVGKLVRMAVADGRSQRPDIELGVCGEHGGDPASIAFFDEVGLNYVSCSPFRVPVARLAAAQAVISGSYSTK